MAASAIARVMAVGLLVDAHFEKKTAYRDLSYIPCGSVIAERLFSQAKYVIPDSRASLDPDNVDGTLFLRYNKAFWGLPEINKLIVD
jgi:hypothetical protein